MALLRTLLFAPGNHPRRVEKALTLQADAVILDLEDAVAVAEKPGSRAIVVGALRKPRRSRGYVRVNALNTEFGYADLVAVVQPGVDGIVLPKVETPDQLKTADWLIAQLERERGLAAGGIDLLPIVETGLGFTNLQAIACSGTRVRRLSFGAGDFTLDVGITWSSEEGELLPYRSAFVVISRAAGLEPPLDTVWIDIHDHEGFRRSTELVKALGFQGKLCIHPDQVPVANGIFTPTEAEVNRARRIIDAFAEAEAKGLASIQVDGRFVDYPIVDLARRVLAKADAIAAAARPA
jgi:citrate lyase subunit beta/citryl-CoA lyase